MPIKKTTTRTSRKTSSHKTRVKKIRTKKDDKIIKEKEKEVFVSDMKKTLRDIGRVPALIFAPVVAYVGKKYDSIPEARRKKLDGIMKSAKNQGGSVLGKLKEWFQGMLRHDASNKKSSSKKTTTKKKKNDGIFAQLKNKTNKTITEGKETLNKAKKTVTEKAKSASTTPKKKITRTRKKTTRKPSTTKTATKKNTATRKPITKKTTTRTVKKTSTTRKPRTKRTSIKK